MSKAAKIQFVCQACGSSYGKWLGRCSNCGEWNSVVEERVDTRPTTTSAAASKPAEVLAVHAEKTRPRILTHVDELDRVLGGGLVPGSVVLLGGEPGIGKSTLLLQALAKITEPALYVTGEESAEQIADRARRLQLDDTLSRGTLRILATNMLGDALAHLAAHQVRVAVIDSLQTMFEPSLESAPGTVSQVREVAHRLTEIAKREGLALLLVGQINKDGALAGPKVVEHLVDAVLYFDAEAGDELRILRAHKNRYGAVSEVGIFEMTGGGLIGVENPSQRFLSERTADAPGSVVTAQLTGHRPLLTEVQALTVQTSFGLPRRTSIGFDQNRLAMLIAVLERKAGIELMGFDVYLNAVGGLKLTEPAADLAVALALASAQRGHTVGRETIAFGELGLTGEIRRVSRVEARIDEARRLGFTRILLPEGHRGKVKDAADLVWCGSIAAAVDRVGLS